MQAAVIMLFTVERALLLLEAGPHREPRLLEDVFPAGVHGRRDACARRQRVRC